MDRAPLSHRPSGWASVSDSAFHAIPRDPGNVIVLTRPEIQSREYIDGFQMTDWVVVSYATLRSVRRARVDSSARS